MVVLSSDHRPTLLELTCVSGKARPFNIAAEIGMRYYAVGTALLKDESRTVILGIVSKHAIDDAKQINMDVLSRWMQGSGIADRTWRGLLGVLRVHCPGLAQDIEETLRAEADLSEDVVISSIEPEGESIASHSTLCSKSGAIQTSEPPPPPLPPALPALPLSRPSLEDCFSHAGISVDCAILDKNITSRESIADIAKKLTRWRDLFPYFGLEEYEKEEIEVVGDLGEQKRRLLTIWTQKLGPRATYRHLCAILLKQHRVDLVETVCKVVQSLTIQSASVEMARVTRLEESCPERLHPKPPPPSHHRPLTPALKQYSGHLRAFYKRSEIPNLKWPPSHGKKFINLAVINKDDIMPKEADEFTYATIRGDLDQILKTKAPIELESILKVDAEKQLKCVLVEGAPGVGKSTLAWHVCQQWGKGELFQEFTTVQLLQLRDARVQAATCVEDLFLHYDKKLQSRVAQEISDLYGEGSLIILDGLDELPSGFLSQPSVFTGLLSGEVLPEATIMVTSRPSATYDLWKDWNQQISRHIEIIGFTRKNITEYIESVLPPQELPQFQDYLSMHPHIEHMMYVPLHCAIVTIVYSECEKSRKPPPRTLTGLYTCLAQTLLIRYLSDHPDYKGKHYYLDEFSKLPQPVYNDFKELCSLAFEGLVQDKLIFYDLSPECNHLGFMASVPDLMLYQQAACYSHNFLHLSVQEFLAAYHISLRSSQYQERVIRDSHRDGLSSKKRFREHKHFHWINTVSFLAGITQFNSLGKAVVRKLIGISNGRHGHLDKQWLGIIHETQNVLNVLDSECHYEVELFPLSSDSHHAYVALGYCIANSRSKWTLLWNHTTNQYRGKSDCSGLKACTQQLNEGGSYTIGELLLNQCPPDAIELLLPAATSLETLRMWQCEVSEQGALAMAEMLKYITTLTELDIRDSSMDIMGVVAMAEALKYNTVLTVLKTTFGDDGSLVIAKMLKHNTALRELHMVRKMRAGAIVENFSGVIGAFFAMKDFLYLGPELPFDPNAGNPIGIEGTKALVESLAVNHHLEKLVISKEYQMYIEVDPTHRVQFI